jgi:Tol biopolymer transport system component
MGTCVRQLLVAILVTGWAAVAVSGEVGTTGTVADSGVGTTGTIAFVRRQNSINHIYLMEVDASGAGSNPTRLTNDDEAENYPSWSPDGKRLLYQRDFNGAAIYVINADGTGEQRLSPTPGFDAVPSWSPDGTKIIYARVLAAPQPGMPPLTDIRVMNADGTGDHAILANTLFSVEPRWSVNNQVVFMSLMNGSAFEIYVMNLDGIDLRQLTNAGNNGDPVWSPDGTRITFGSDREGGNKLNIFVMNADGSQQEQLTHFDVPYEAGDTNWSSDGKKIAFEYDINGMKQSDPNAYAEVWTMNPDGSGETSTGVQCSGVGCAPRWQPRASAQPPTTTTQEPVPLSPWTALGTAFGLLLLGLALQRRMRR